ncbi:hypothetical protein C1645_758800, partial [Glomus cerebriforme]
MCDCFIDFIRFIGFILFLIEFAMISVFQYFNPEVFRIECNGKFSVLTNCNSIIFFLILLIIVIFKNYYFTLMSTF